MLHRGGNYASAMEMNMEKLDIINSSLAAMLVSERTTRCLVFGSAEVRCFFSSAMRGINCASFDREISGNSGSKNREKYTRARAAIEKIESRKKSCV